MRKLVHITLKIILTYAIFTGGVLFSYAQIDSSSVHESADSTIVEAETIDSNVTAIESPKNSPAIEDDLTDQEKVIAARLKVLQNEVKLTYNKKIKSFIDYF